MAAGDMITATLNTLTAYNTLANITTAATANAGTADTDGLKQDYTFTPTKAESKCLLLVTAIGPTATKADDNLAYSVAAGANAFDNNAALTGSITKDTTDIIVLDGKYKSATGTFVVTFTPTANDKIKTNHGLTVNFIELP